MFHQMTLSRLSQGLSKGEFSALELTENFLARIQKYDPLLNSFITVTTEAALAQAKLADQQLQKKIATAITGIPIAQKDIFCTKGVKTSCASKMLDNFISPYDATTVEKFKQAGAIMLGKTNMDEFAMGSSNEHSYYGPCKNPWDLSASPGGSSGGSAAAVAARLVLGATGTDTGGSIRQPAAFCGITGLKPTYGRVSRYGMIAFASSLDQGGIMAQNAEDAALLFQHMAGYDHRDSTSLNEPVPDYVAELNSSIKGLNIGIPEEYFTAELDPATADLIQQAIRELEKLGAKCHSIKLPNTKLAIPTYYVIAPAECSSNLARYDGVRFGYRCKDPQSLDDLYKRTRQEGFGKEVKQRIFIGTYVLSSGYYDAYYLQAQKVRALISDDFKQAFKKVDLIVSPTTPGPAFKLGAKLNDPVSMYLNDIYTVSVNLAGLPAISLPCGFLNQMPIGLQIIGNYLQESLLLNIAHQYQQVTDWHTRLPQQFA